MPIALKRQWNFTFSSSSRYKKLNYCKYTCIYVNIFAETAKDSV